MEYTATGKVKSSVYFFRYYSLLSYTQSSHQEKSDSHYRVWWELIGSPMLYSSSSAYSTSFKQDFLCYLSH